MYSLNRNKVGMFPVLLSGGLGISQLLLQLQHNASKSWTRGQFLVVQIQIRKWVKSPSWWEVRSKETLYYSIWEWMKIKCHCIRLQPHHTSSCSGTKTSHERWAVSAVHRPASVETKLFPEMSSLQLENIHSILGRTLRPKVRHPLSNVLELSLAMGESVGIRSSPARIGQWKFIGSVPDLRVSNN